MVGLKSYEKSKPSFTQAVVHLVLFSKSVQEDYNDAVQGKETRYRKITLLEERAEVRTKKRRKLTDFLSPMEDRLTDRKTSQLNPTQMSISILFLLE